MVLVPPEQTESILEFCENVFFKIDRQSKTVFTNYFGRQHRLATNFLMILDRLSRSIAKTLDPRSDNVRRLIAEITEQIVRNLFRRRQTIGDRQFDEVSALILQIMENISIDGNKPEALFELVEIFGINKRQSKTGPSSKNE